MVVEAQATPRLASKVIERVRSVTDKPITHLALTHYHAVRVLGASAFKAPNVIMSRMARAQVAERGRRTGIASSAGFRGCSRGTRHPRADLAHHDLLRVMTVYLGKRRVDLMQLGRAHTAGDIVVCVPDAQVMFTGDIVEYHSACYCGDGHFSDWPRHARRDRRFELRRHRAGTRRRAGRRGQGERGAGHDRAISSTLDLPARGAGRARGGGSLKEAWDACRAACDPKFSTTRSTSTACPSTSRAPMTRRAASTLRASGRPNATARCGTQLQG